VELSDDEHDRWRHIEAELAGERRLVGLSRRLATSGPGLPVRTCLCWLLGGLTGMIALIAGNVTHTSGLVTAGVGVLIATVVVSGALLIVIGVRSPSTGDHH
jgi:hypothetical protein